jgi:hypothetical protein
MDWSKFNTGQVIQLNEFHYKNQQARANAAPENGQPHETTYMGQEGI